MMQLQIEKDWSGQNYSFVVSDGFNKASFTCEAWRISDYQLQEARRVVQNGYDVNSSLTAVKQALGFW